MADDDGEETETDEERPPFKEDDSDSDESIAETVDEPVTFNSVQPLDPSVAVSWDFSTKKKTYQNLELTETSSSRILCLLDAHNGNGFAMRRAPSNLRYGSGPLKHFLVRGGELVTLVLVSRLE
ncbi:hypothetical protein FRC01_003482 [Tulasnella sp. 417]|nr:hypothetical protein FRC01_003482 [Tulasnella sp. 417]